MEKEKLSEYDLNKLKKARQLVTEVYEYIYSPSSVTAKRLFTIVGKLDKVIERGEQ